MRVDAERMLEARKSLAWSQQELAEASGLNLRTIQRIERTGAASLRSLRSLAAVLDLDIQELNNEEHTMSPCPHCGSSDLYESKNLIDTTTIGGELLPKLSSSRFSSAKVRAVVCETCGYLRYFVAPEALAKLSSSPHWIAVNEPAPADT